MGREVLLVCMATEHNCFVNPYCSHVLSDNLYPIHSIYTIITSFIMQSIVSSIRNGASLATRYGTRITGSQNWFVYAAWMLHAWHTV